MSYLCASCEHAPEQHYQGWGRCEQPCLDPDTGELWACVCPLFEQDTDE